MHSQLKKQMRETRSFAAHLRNVTVFADAEVDRSPCGTGTAAVMAVLNDMGLLLDDLPAQREKLIEMGIAISQLSSANSTRAWVGV